MWVRPGAINSGSSRAGVLPGEREQQQVVFVHNALLMVPSEVIGAVSGAYSQASSGGWPCPPLESEITLVLCLLPPLDHVRSTPFSFAHTGGAA